MLGVAASGGIIGACASAAIGAEANSTTRKFLPARRNILTILKMQQ
jgi:hypothetical protein